MPELWTHHVAPFMLVLARVGGLFVFAPLLSSAAPPMQARALLAVMFAAVLYPILTASPAAAAAAPGSWDLPSAAVLLASEALVGAAIGFLAAVPVLAVQVGGMVMGQQLGLGLAAVYNPAMETDGDLVGELLLYLAMAVFMALGGLEAAFLAVARGFEHLPPGAFAAGPAAASVLGIAVGRVHAGCELALRVAAPVLCILMLETLAAGLVMKIMPQLNILSVGFAVKIVLGFMALAAAVHAVGDAVGEEMQRGLRAMLEWSIGR